MLFELDHLFICASIGAPEAAHLLEFGLTEGTPNMHSGQGTANRRFFFRNAMIELLWVHDSNEAQSKATQDTRLWERWSGRGKGTCPFGLCFRPSAPNISELPFAAWEYRPRYLDSSRTIHVGTNSQVLSEPMLVYLAFGQRPERHSTIKPESLEHPAGLTKVTRVELVSPHSQTVSTELQDVIHANLVGMHEGGEYGIELGFDGERQGNTADFRPSLPLIFRW